MAISAGQVRRPGAVSRTSRRAASTSRATGREHALGVDLGVVVGLAVRPDVVLQLPDRAAQHGHLRQVGSRLAHAGGDDRLGDGVRRAFQLHDDRPPRGGAGADRRRLGQPALQLGLQLGERAVVAPAGAAALGRAAGERGLDERVEGRGGVAQRLVERRPPGLGPQQVAEDEDDRAADEGVGQPLADQARAARQRQVEHQDDHRGLEHREQAEVGGAGPRQHGGERGHGEDQPRAAGEQRQQRRADAARRAACRRRAGSPGRTPTRSRA